MDVSLEEEGDERQKVGSRSAAGVMEMSQERMAAPTDGAFPSDWSTTGTRGISSTNEPSNNDINTLIISTNLFSMMAHVCFRMWRRPKHTQTPPSSNAEDVQHLETFQPWKHGQNTFGSNVRL